ncbi:MAG: SOS response-associated peptidase [Bacillota bacterium]
MCGRFTLTMDPRTFEEAVASMYEVDYDPSLASLPRYNIAPGQDVLALIHDGAKYRLGTLRWGIPLKSRSGSSRPLVNARSETIHEKPLFKESFLKRRCLILADGYYEWKSGPEGKIPMRIHPERRDLFTMAGIYEPFIEKDGSTTYRFAIVTKGADETVASIHDRMPLILQRAQEEAWVHPENHGRIQTLKAMLDDHPVEALGHYPVDPMVNDPKNDTPECIVPVKSHDMNLFDTR